MMVARYVGGDGAALDVSGPVARERRRAPRIDSTIRAVIRSERFNTPSKARAIDISDHGARLQLRRRLTLGQRIELDLECELPLRVHLGYDADSLVIDGPMHTHLVRVTACVVRADRLANRFWDIGVEFGLDDACSQDLRAIQHYIDHVREQETWAI